MEPQPPSTASQLQQTSLIGRMINVFVSPTEAFDEVKMSQHRISNWLAPLILSMIAAFISVYVMFSQPAMVQSMKEKNDKKFQEAVQAGKMTQAKADDLSDNIQKWLVPVFAAFGFFMTAVVFFIAAAISFFLGRVVFKSEMRFTQAMEITGLASFVSILGTVLGTLLTIIYGQVGMTPGFILLIGKYDPTNRLHIILSVLNLASLWYIAVLSLGVSRVSGGSWIKAALLIFVVWALFTLGPSLVFVPK